MSPPPSLPLPDLAPIIHRVQSRFIRAADASDVFDPLLPELLSITDSGYGFVGEVWRKPDGTPYLKIFTLTDITWDEATRTMYRRERRNGIEFHNLNNLLGAAMLTREPVLSNAPQSDKRSGGLPHGHPGMTAYLGMPLFHGGELVGMCGLANRPGGYDEALVGALEPLWSAVGAIIGAVQLQRDRARAEATYRLTFELSPVGIWHHPPGGGAFTRVNPRFCEMLGYEPDELLRLSWADVTHPDDVSEQQARNDALLAGRVVDYRIDKRYRHRDGRTVWGELRVTLVRDAAGAPDYLIGVCQDITDRIHNEQQLRERDERLHKLTQQAPGVIFQLVVDSAHTHSRIPYASAGLREVFGVDPADVVHDARPLFRAVVPEQRHRTAESIVQSSIALEEWRNEFEIERADGTRRWIEGHSRPERLPDGSTIWHGYMADITDRKRYEQAVAAADDAERANAAKTEFLSRMSHELRTPLNAVLGFAQLLRMDQRAPLQAAQRERVDHIERAGSHLLGMINDVLDLSRIEAGALSLSIETVQAQSALAEALELVSNAAVEAGVALQQHADPALYLRGDRLRLRQVLVNLVSNAIKYNRRGGHVTVSAVSDGNAAMLLVTDTGAGLDEAQLGQLFQPFNRLGAERGPVEGTGIGLVITQRLVEVMGGTLAVASRPGVGSVFSVRLPLGTRPLFDAPEAASDGAAAQVAGRTLRLLYVEDNPVNVELVQQVVRLRPRVQLAVADSGARALAVVAERRPDLLLVDMQLGDMSGLELAEALDRSPVTAGIPRVALSADAMPERVQQARQRGFAPYLTKPLDIAALLRCLDEWLDELSAPATQ